MTNDHNQTGMKSQSPDDEGIASKIEHDEDISSPKGPVADFWRALALLSRVPVSATCDFRPVAIARSVWCWPLVGLFIAGIAIIPAYLTEVLTGNGMIAAIVATLALILLTGAMHEDGIADCADGFGGGQDKLRKLEIMRDSRIGTYGVVALVLCLAMRVAVLAAAGESGSMAAILIVMATLSRAAMPIVTYVFDPAREDGLGKGAGRPDIRMVAAGLAVALMLVVIVAGALTAFMCLVAMMVGASIVGWIARHQIGGHTGDVLGMTQIISELFVGIAFIAVLQVTW
ncbi:cobalamin biosynthesis protein CobS [Thalassospira xiamenensis]|uniref:adenosylcobinamide-GDP ribazoletransferase n=1 Tax=Thalassospira xiamenensis TaxID=220697 RepID=UPI000DED6124|nr:adenosylcobinamide-GDP ribazoletransferase [Thalassospira xiamenensis]RCK35296.1 cobalamin biosynthesis protein CobS [Thalassospira xiamenensis]